MMSSMVTKTLRFVGLEMLVWGVVGLSFPPALFVAVGLIAAGLGLQYIAFIRP